MNGSSKVLNPQFLLYQKLEQRKVKLKGKQQIQ